MQKRNVATECIRRSNSSRNKDNEDWTHAEIGNVLFVEFWWLNMQNWFYHLNHTQSLGLPPSLSPSQTLLSISSERKEWKIVKKRRKKFEAGKNESRAIKCRLFRLPLSMAHELQVFKWTTTTAQPKEKQKLMMIISFFVCRANIKFVHENVCTQLRCVCINGTTSGSTLLNP